MSLAQILAAAPAPLKGTLSVRIARKILRSQEPKHVITNLGISSKIKFRVPSNRFNYAYGNPRLDIAERGTLELATQLSVYSDAFLDVGANYGLFTASILAANPSLPVCSVEADPKIAEELRRNLDRSGFASCVVNAAACDKTGTIRFFRNDDDDLSGSLTDHFTGKHDTTIIEVEALKLSSLIDQFQCQSALVKIDVEGAGVAAWNGLLAAADRVAGVIIEVIAPEAEARLPDIISRQTGWHSYYIDDYILRKVTFDRYLYRPPFWNWLLSSCSPEELTRKLKPPLRVE